MSFSFLLLLLAGIAIGIQKRERFYRFLNWYPSTVQLGDGGWRRAGKILVYVVTAALIGGILWTLYTRVTWDHPPTLAETWGMMSKYWLVIFLACGLLYLIGSLIKKVESKDGKRMENSHLCTVLHGLAYAGLATFIVIALAYDIFAAPPTKLVPNYALPTVPNGDCRVSCAIALPRYGQSLPLPVPVGKQPHAEGAGYAIKCVYADGSEGILGDALRPCHDGNMRYALLVDTSGNDTNIVLYSPKYP